MTNKTKFLVKLLIGILLIGVFLLGIQVMITFSVPNWISMLYGMFCGWYFDDAIAYFYNLFAKATNG